jgi:hypothetical protein
MRKASHLILPALLVLTIFPIQLKSEPESSSLSDEKSVITSSEKVNMDTVHFIEIAVMDKSALSLPESSESNIKVSETKSEIKELGVGGYIITGAVIIVIVLLLIIALEVLLI